MLVLYIVFMSWCWLLLGNSWFLEPSTDRQVRCCILR